MRDVDKRQGLVCGLGAGGITAAAAAAEKGMNVIAIEKGAGHGSIKSDIGVIGTRIDTVEVDPLQMLNEHTRYANGWCDPRVTRVWATESGATFDWISDSIAEFGATPYFEYDVDAVSYTHLDVYKRQLPADDVFMDHAGFSTYESMYRARDVFGAKRIVIVSQKYHLYRALYVAERLGLDAYGVSADLRPYAGQEARELREVLARNKDFFTAIVQPPPTFLGDPISLSGSASVTEG